MRAAGAGAEQGPGRVLWRVDGHASSGLVSLYLLSPSAPDCEQILAEAAVAGTQARSLDYSPFLDRLGDDQVWAFRLAANPSWSRSQGTGKRGKRSGHVTVEQQRQWLVSRSEKCGFEPVLAGDSADGGKEALVSVTRRERPVFGRDNPYGHGRDRVTINRTVYEGVLRVTDAEALRTVLVSGIGRSKAYGCGLMTLARVQRG